MGTVFPILASIVIFGCSIFIFRKRLQKRQLDLSHFRGLIIGHRGCRYETIPENSMFAFTKALEDGFQGIEVDVRLTSDEKVVVLHDEFIERVLDGIGNCCDMTFEALQRIPYRQDVSALPLTSEWENFLSNNYPNERADRVPSLEQVILFAKRHHLKIIIDLKEVKRRELLYKKLVELFDKYDLYQDAIVACFNPLDMYRFRSICADAPIVTCLLYCKGLLQWYHDENSEEMRLPWLLDIAAIRYCLDEALTVLAPTLLAGFFGC